MLLMVVVSTGVASAVNKTRNNSLCEDTENDVLYERVGNGLGDTIYGF